MIRILERNPQLHPWDHSRCLVEEGIQRSPQRDGVLLHPAPILHDQDDVEDLQSRTDVEDVLELRAGAGDAVDTDVVHDDVVGVVVDEEAEVGGEF